MKRILAINILLVSLMALSMNLHARGGGGCLEKGTLISTPSGLKPIETLKINDTVLASGSAGVVQAKVCGLIQVKPEFYYEIACGERKIRATTEHPVEVGAGEYKIASSLKVGDKVRLSDGRKIGFGKIDSISRIPSSNPAFTLLVSPCATYIANGIVVHNKGGGCFLPDTPIRKADGTETAVGTVVPGDRILAFREDGEVLETSVQRVMTHVVDEYIEVRTGRIILNVTSEHPFFVGNGIFKNVAALNIGDMIYAIDGNHLSAQKIEGMRKIRESTLVYNLQTDEPNTYFANGVAVHNKGGGGGFHSSGGGHGGSGISGGPPKASDWIVFGVVAAIIIVIFICKNRQGGNNENLDFVYSPAKVALKSKKTLKLLEFLSKQDQSVAPEKLTDVARSTFLKLQECWQARDYAPMKALMMPDLFLEHNRQIKGMIHNHEINIIGNLNADRIDLVNVRYTFKENQREFTALVTATAKDYYIDDRSRKKIRGDDVSAQFQEFWTFQYFNKAWLLREIEQTRESDALKEENFFEQFTDVGLEQVYGDTAGKEGPAGPWLEHDVEDKDTKIERMLNFLVQTDKIWDRQKMIETARRTFLEMMLTWESGELGNISKTDLFPEVYDTMKEDMMSNHQRGIKMEFRNLCVRKVELLLVRNFDDNSKDEFVARIRAHAQKVMEQNGKTISQDDDVAPFEQYLTFGRVYNQWKLKEMLLPGNESGLVGQENLDQDSNAQQLQWYYQHRRAV